MRVVKINNNLYLSLQTSEVFMTCKISKTHNFNKRIFLNAILKLLNLTIKILSANCLEKGLKSNLSLVFFNNYSVL